MTSTSLSLTPWQKKQATLIYHFASLDYLKGVKERVHKLRIFAEGDLYLSQVEGRDRLLRSKRWGNRDTSENWANNAWPFLADLQQSVASDIAARASQIYDVTGVYQCARGMSEYSLRWMSLDKEDQFNAMFRELSDYAGNIDNTMARSSRTSKWKDFSLARRWQQYASLFAVLPKLRVLDHITAESGQLPPLTGVYVSINDPDAALQFAWTGCPDGRLLEGVTFSDLGKAALTAVGRKKLWVDNKAMYDFVATSSFLSELKNDAFYEEPLNETLASGLVARNAFTSRPSRWAYVEMLSGEFEPIEDDGDAPRAQGMSFAAGAACPKRGFYFTPAHIGSRRHFEAGETFPDFDSSYGKTFWQWDTEQFIRE